MNPLQLKCVNHLSLICSSVEKSLDFYHNLLGFVPVKRPESFKFIGAWLVGHGIGLHLLESEDPQPIKVKKEINPRDNHISFQCLTNMSELEKKLEELGIRFVKATVKEGEIEVHQVFFHDPDGYMVEICSCENFPVIPLAAAPSCSLPPQ
ncbi:hypothetical protein Tsubulata_019068 [Turnera subulata]|uniref:VOC domain-containing protein n=1 Tax=Turnera subulata TaxID=218843 RepID=A0A9Q0JL47_9ROSI|nr:hypothetical protein Tsubulata_019068 [Turnera subulata]